MFDLHLNEVPRRETNFTVRGDEFWSSIPREDPGGPSRESTCGCADESTRRSSRESLWDFSREDPRGNTREITRSERLEDTRTRFDPCFKCPLCSCSHTLWNCKTFKGKSYQGRLDVTFQKRVCLNCLLPGHYAKGCTARGACDRPGCQKKHHSLLHPPVETGERREGEGSPTATQGSVNVLKGGERPSEKRVCLRVVPVRVQGCGNSRIAETYALLDDGSDVPVCDLQLLEQLGLSRIQRQFTLSTLNKEDHEQSGREVSLQITSLDATNSISLPRVWSVDKKPVSEGSFPVPDVVKRWSHLSDIDLPHIDGRKVMLVIGGDCPDAFWVLDERRGTGNEPYAVKVPLG